MVRGYCAIPQGTRVSVELKCGQPIAGTVTWFREPNAGITFDRQIDVIETLSASLHGPRPRMPRIAIDSIVTVRDGASIYRLRGCDVSQGGIKVHSATPIESGTEVVVTLLGLEPQPAVVQRRRAVGADVQPQLVAAFAGRMAAGSARPVVRHQLKR